MNDYSAMAKGQWQEETEEVWKKWKKKSCPTANKNTTIPLRTDLRTKPVVQGEMRDSGRASHGKAAWDNIKIDTH